MGSTQYMDFNHKLQTTTIPATSPLGLALNAQDSDGMTQFHRVRSSRDAGLVETLLFNGITVDIKDYARNEPLHCGVMRMAWYREAPSPIRRNADAGNQLGRTHLHLGRLQAIVDALCQEGAPVSSQGRKGDTPLYLASSKPPGASP